MSPCPVEPSAGSIYRTGWEDSAEFRTFRRNLFHGSLRHILESLKPAMTVPEVTLFADGHYRRVIYGLAHTSPIIPSKFCWLARCKAARSFLFLLSPPLVSDLKRSTSSTLATLQYDDTYWESRFPPGQLRGLTLEGRLQLVFSLMIFLSVSTRQLMHWLFTTEIPSVTKRISHFMGFHTNESTLETQFAPALIFNLWRDGSRWPKAQKYLREMTIPCAHELALQYSNRIIASPHLRV
ncbi:hypothetical protein B0H10DRAFT_2449909 [Mycena sp. CBHHK59/15]|nr:hypothetical protein B0H10DRAFT_2449909 [Mycena sp. CBHHK59/15]